MKKLFFVAAVLALLIVWCALDPGSASANEGEGPLWLAQTDQEASAGEEAEPAATDAEDEYDEAEDEYADEEAELISDPLSGLNRGLYVFNDKLYFWLLKPVARGYKFIIPEELRLAIRNVFYNIRFPVRFVSSLLQGKGRKAGAEFGQFFINSTVGFLGLANVASNYPALQPSREDLGQTFGVWGIGNGAYLMLPFFGPSSVRDGIGKVGDTLLDPLWWVFREEFWLSMGVRGGETVNDTSLRIGDYEALKEAALDPYVAIRNAYVQNRNKLISE